MQRTWDLKLRKTYADPTILKEQNRLEWQECGERGEIERNFGVGKCRYGLDCIVAKLKETSEGMIPASVLSMNLRKKLIYSRSIRLLKS